MGASRQILEEGIVTTVAHPPARGKERPRDWITLDLDYLVQDTIRELASEFGPAGPLVFLSIVLAAKRAAKGGLAVERQGSLACATARWHRRPLWTTQRRFDESWRRL